MLWTKHLMRRTREPGSFELAKTSVVKTSKKNGRHSKVIEANIWGINQVGAMTAGVPDSRLRTREDVPEPPLLIDLRF